MVGVSVGFEWRDVLEECTDNQIMNQLNIDFTAARQLLLPLVSSISVDQDTDATT
jgi:hypothetical protein